jgi:hypothetical protein
MLKQEFEARIGREVSVEEYARIEQEYMSLPDELNVYKDEFCRLYREGGWQKMSATNYLLVRMQNRLKEADRDLKVEKYLSREAYKELKELKRIA